MESNEHRGLNASLKEIDMPYIHSEAYHHSLNWDNRQVLRINQNEIDLLSAAEIDLIMQAKLS